MKEVIVKDIRHLERLSKRKDKNNIIAIINKGKWDLVRNYGLLLDVCGSAQISYMYGSAQIRSMYGSAQIGYMSGSAQISYMYGSAQIGYMYGSAQISNMSGSAQISYMYGSAQISNMSGSAQIRSMSGSAQISSMYGSAQIGYMYGSAQISNMSGSAQIRSMSGSAQIGYMSGSAIIIIDPDSKIKYPKDNPNVISPKKVLQTKEKWLKQFGDIDIKDNFIYLYKSVKDDYTDFRTGKIKYGIGDIVIAPDWNDDVNIECGNGLHLCPHPSDTQLFNVGKILKCKVHVDDILVHPDPQYPLKVRCKKVFVEKEVKDE